MCLFCLFILDIFRVSISNLSLSDLQEQCHQLNDGLLPLAKMLLLSHCTYSSPPLIRTPLLPNSSVLIREVSFGEREHYMYSQYFRTRICVLSRGVSSLECPLREGPLYMYWNCNALHVDIAMIVQFEVTNTATNYNSQQ